MSNLKFLPGDPKKPSEAKRYASSLFTTEDDTPDGWGMLSLLLGSASLIVKSYARFSVWGCVITLLLAIANSKGHENDIKQLVSCFVMTGFALFSVYFQPLSPQTA